METDSEFLLTALCPPADLVMPPVSGLHWSPAFFEALADIDSRLEKEEARESLPFASLRMALQANVPGIYLLGYDLGLRSIQGKDMILLSTAPEGTVDSTRRMAKAWIGRVLGDHVVKRGMPASDLVVLTNLLDAGTWFEIRACRKNDIARNAGILGHLDAAIRGKAVFPDAPSIRRIIGTDFSHDEIKYETWPMLAGKKIFSLTLQLKVEEQPFGGAPIVTVNAGRRGWSRQDMLTGGKAKGHIMFANRDQSMEVELIAGDKGKLLASQFAAIAQAIEWDGETDFSHATFTSPDIEAREFRGYLTPPQWKRKSPPIGRGVAELDLVAVTKSISDLSGWGLLQGRLIKPSAANTTKFPRVDAAELATGSVPDEEMFADDAMEVMLGPDYRTEPAFGKAILNRSKMREFREENTLYLEASATTRRKLGVIAATEGEMETLGLVARAFASPDVLPVHTVAIPVGAHGPKREMRGSNNVDIERYQMRRAAWKHVIADLRKNGVTDVLVQAAQWYGEDHDDKVNKAAARHELAMNGFRVQYVLPREDDGQAARKNHAHRVQSALRDLLFAHNGYAPDMAARMEKLFGDEPAPRYVLGLCIVQTGKRRGVIGKGSSIAVALRTETATGRTMAALQYARNQDPFAWTPFEQFLLDLPVKGHITLGKPAETAGLVQSFFQEAILSTVDLDPSALVLVDGVSGGIRRLWKWLGDDRFSGTRIECVEGFDVTDKMASVRFARIISGEDGALVSRGRAGDLNTTSRAIVEILSSEAGSHYWLTPGYPSTNGPPRWISAYRQKPKVKMVDGVWVDAEPLELVRPDDDRTFPKTTKVSVAGGRVNPDRVADAVLNLRGGYLHYADMSAMPMPLHFATKIVDYLVRIARKWNDKSQAYEDTFDDGED